MLLVFLLLMVAAAVTAFLVNEGRTLLPFEERELEDNCVGVVDETVLFNFEFEPTAFKLVCSPSNLLQFRQTCRWLDCGSNCGQTGSLAVIKKYAQTRQRKDYVLS